MFIAKLFVYICEKSYPLNSYHTMHMCQQLQQTTTTETETTTNRSETIYAMEKTCIFQYSNKYIWMCTWLCVCVSLSLFLAYIFYSNIILCNQKQITNSRREGDRQKWRETTNALQYEFRLRNLRLYLQKQPKDERQSRRTVPHGHLLNYSLRQGREGGVLQSQVSPSLKLDWLYRKLSGPKQISVAEGKLSHPTCRLFFYVSKRKFATVFRILFV